jgi:hypothetical protein
MTCQIWLEGDQRRIWAQSLAFKQVIKGVLPRADFLTCWRNNGIILA